MIETLIPYIFCFGLGGITCWAAIQKRLLPATLSPEGLEALKEIGIALSDGKITPDEVHNICTSFLKCLKKS